MPGHLTTFLSPVITFVMQRVQQPRHRALLFSSSPLLLSFSSPLLLLSFSLISFLHLSLCRSAADTLRGLCFSAVARRCFWSSACPVCVCVCVCVCVLC